MRRSDRIIAFTETLWEWYAVHKRVLPWRDMGIADDDERAYRILVSEIMLQQTQVDRVKITFRTFLERFPTLHSLAEASNRDVLIAWRGMGYNSRALRLRDAARAILAKYQIPNPNDQGRSKIQDPRSKTHTDSVFPQTMIELMAIPGIGPYTAAAIRNFAFNLPTPCIDTNIRRILHRTFFGPENRDGTWKKDDHILLGIAEDVLQEAMDGQKDHDTRNWHAALMDFGSLIQTKRNPQWEECPLTEKGIMVTSRKSASLPSRRSRSSAGKGWNEPGREIGGRFIPNRIIRGRIVEELRDEPKGLKLAEIGRRVCIDWAMRRHQRWMKELLEKLQKDRLIAERKGKFLLSSDG